jgi:hypothetical protein
MLNGNHSKWQFKRGDDRVKGEAHRSGWKPAAERSGFVVRGKHRWRLKGILLRALDISISKKQRITLRNINHDGRGTLLKGATI